MKKLTLNIFYVISLIVFNAVCYSQVLTIFNFDDSNFPLMKANLIAVDSIGNQIQIDASKITLKENTESKTITYFSNTPNGDLSGISSVIMIDASASMNALIDNISILKCATEASKYWINCLPSDKFECGITSFNNVSLINQDITNDKNQLYTAIDNIITKNEATDYQTAFNDYKTGALKIANKGIYKKIIIFITNGNCNLNADSIIAIAKASNIVIYPIIIEGVSTTSIQEIADSTGGKYFENIKYSANLAGIFMQIFYSVENFEPCQIQWNDESCNIYIKMQVTFDLLSTTQDFLKNQKYMPQNIISPAYIYRFGEVNPGMSKDTIITITALNQNLVVKDINFDNSEFSIYDYYGSAPPFIINKNEYRNIKIRFSPIDSAYTTGKIIIQSNSCDENEIWLTGGNPSINKNFDTLKIVQPNGGETYAVYSDTTIKWKGIGYDDTVKIEYSTDYSKWITISDSATNYNYLWHVPKTPSQICQLKVTQLTGVSGYKLTIVTDHLTAVSAIDWSKTANKIVSGGCEGNVTLWDAITGGDYYTINVNGARITYLKFSPDGKYFLANGNIFLTDDGSNYNSGMSYSLGDPASWSPDSKYIVYNSNINDSIKTKYHLLFYNFLQKANIDSIQVFHRRALSLDWSPDGKYIAGFFDDSCIMVFDFSTKSIIDSFYFNRGSYPIISFSHSGKYFVYCSYGDSNICIYDYINKKKVLSFKHLVLGLVWGADDSFIATIDEWSQVLMWNTKTGNQIISNDNYEVPCGWATIALSPDGRYAACGDDNCEINIWGLNRVYQQDVSDKFWSIVEPSIKTKDIDIGKAQLNIEKDSVIQSFVTNNSLISVRIDSIKITGANENEFNIIVNDAPYNLLPSESHAISIKFIPEVLGLRTAQLEVYSRTDTIKSTIIGTGVESSLKAGELIDFGAVSINSYKDTAQAIIKNIGVSSVTIDTAVISGPDITQFIILDSILKFTLSPNESKTMTLRFKPSKIEQTCSEINFYGDSIYCPINILLLGSGIDSNARITLKAGNISAPIGSEVKIPILLTNRFNFYLSDTIFINADMKFNGTLLVPIKDTPEGTFNNGVRTIPLTIPVKSIANDTLIEYSFITTLGNSEASDIILSNATSNNKRIIIKTDTGKISLNNVCQQGGPRLVFNSKRFGFYETVPNPAHDIVKINYEIIEKGQTVLTLTDIYGRTLETVFSNKKEAGNYMETIDVSGFSSGLYFLILKSPSQIVSEKIEIVK